MRGSKLLCVVACGCLLTAVHADDSESLLDATIEKWSAASSDCRSLDTQLTVFEYDRTWGDKKPKHGRFVYQRDGASRYQVKDFGDILWTTTTTLYLDPEKKSCWGYSKDEVEAAIKRRNELLDGDRHWWQFFEFLFISTAIRAEEVIPHLLLLDPDDLRSCCTLSIEEREDRVFVTARPNPIRNDGLDELRYCFDKDSTLPIAVRQRWTSGRVVVHVLNEMHLNEFSEDDAFLNPDVRSWHKITSYKGDTKNGNGEH